MAELNLSPSWEQIDAGREELEACDYPGRVLIQGVSEDTRLILQGYGLTGRSEGSMKRIFIDEDGIIRTIAPGMTAEEMAKVPNAPLIYYTAMREQHGLYVVSNGAQTDPVLEGMVEGKTLEQSMKDAPTVTVEGKDGAEDIDLSIYEPDAPNFTSRITGVVDVRDSNRIGFGLLTVRKSLESDEPIYDIYEAHNGGLPMGVGFGVRTYLQNNEDGPLPAYDQAPFVLPIGNSAEALARSMWEIFPEDKRAAVVARAVNLVTGQVVETKFIDNYENQAA
jgi:IMP cyclohydrolase